MQAQYLRAVLDYWLDPETNPVSDVYGGKMIDVARAHAWAWDARPWPAFPHDLERWSDGANWQTGHWLTGRLDAAPLDLVVAEICETAGLLHYDVSRLHGLVRGHVSGQTETARAALQPLMIAHGFDAVEAEGRLTFRPMPRVPGAQVSDAQTALDEEDRGGISRVRAAEAETMGRLRIGYTDGEATYDDRVAEAALPGDDADAVTDLGLPLALIPSEALGIAERRLAEARVARDSIAFSMPPSARSMGAGEVIALPDGSTWRIDHVLDRGARDIQAVRVEPSTADPSDVTLEPAPVAPFLPPLPVSPIFMDLPLLTGEEVPHAPHVAVAATPWPGSVAVYKAPGPDGFVLNRLVERGAIGRDAADATCRRPGRCLGSGRSGSGADRLGPVVVGRGRCRVERSECRSHRAGRRRGMGGPAIRQGGAGDRGGMGDFPSPAGAGGQRCRHARGLAGGQPIRLARHCCHPSRPSRLGAGLARHWRVGPARRALDDPSYVERVLAFDGIGLRPLRPVHLRVQRDGTGPGIQLDQARSDRCRQLVRPSTCRWVRASSNITCGSSTRRVCGVRQ
jgi:hypothetical protein